MKATRKQVRYAFFLLAKAGYPTRFMSAQFKRLGATMRERSGTVNNWLESMNVARISQVISQLREIVDA